MSAAEAGARSAHPVDPTGAVADWWATDISNIAPGVIELRGNPIGDLLRERGFTEVIWMLTAGDFPTPGRRRLLEAALVASVDHGPQAPSIASARMAATCGVGLNNAIANGVNTLGDVHGGAGQQCVELLVEIVAAQDEGRTLRSATEEVVARWRERSRYLPGFGHRFHPVDPRREPVLEIIEQARAEGVIAGRHLGAGLAVEELLNRGRPRPIPINVDGITAIIYAELGIAPELARGLFVLARSVGILAHAWEETQGGRRIKGGGTGLAGGAAAATLGEAGYLADDAPAVPGKRHRGASWKCRMLFWDRPSIARDRRFRLGQQLYRLPAPGDIFGVSHFSRASQAREAERRDLCPLYGLQGSTSERLSDRQLSLFYRQ